MSGRLRSYLNPVVLQSDGESETERKWLFTVIMTAGVLVSMAGIYHEAVNMSDMLGAGLFLLQGAFFLLYYSLRTGKVRKRK